MPVLSRAQRNARSKRASSPAPKRWVGSGALELPDLTLSPISEATIQRLHRAVMQVGNQAPSLPNMFPSLVERQIAIRIGEVSLIAGQPASGKSSLAMALAVRSKVPTLYLSADTHAHTMSMRLIAMLTDTDQSVVEQAMAQDPQWAPEMLQQSDHIRWSFDSAPTVESIEDQILAHIELYSRAPQLVVVDNLTDVVVDGDEFGGMRSTMKDFKFLSREYNCALLVLHHASEGVQGNPCPPRFALLGKVAQTPAVVLTVAQNDAGFLGIAPVKNRYGPGNPAGTDPVWLRYDPAKMQVTEVDSEFDVPGVA